MDFKTFKINCNWTCLNFIEETKERRFLHLHQNCKVSKAMFYEKSTSIVFDLSEQDLG